MRYQVRRRSSKSTTRRGSITVWSLFALITAGFCLALVLNTARLSQLRADAQRCSEAAALAACRALLKDSMLRREQPQFEVDGRVLDAQDAGVAIASRYQRRSRLPAMNRNSIHVLQRARIPETNEDFYYRDTLAPNFVRVVLSNGNPVDYSGQLLLGGLTGIGQGRISGTSAACLENSVTGFQSGKRTPIPIVPMAIPDMTVETKGLWSRQIEEFEGDDQWTWNESQRVVEQHADGLPEITLRVAMDSASCQDQLRMLTWFENTGDNRNAIDELTHGLIRGRDAETTASLSFPCTAFPAFPGESDTSSLLQSLESLRGIARIYPLYDVTETSEEQTLVLLRPIAARIMDVQVETLSDIRVTLQPCVLSTATAVIKGSDDRPNRYIWRVSLTQ